MNKIKHYFVNGHTSIGFYSVIPEIAKTLDCLFVLKELSTVEADRFFRRLGNAYLEQGENVDYFHSPNDNDKLEGIRIPNKKIAVFANETIKKVNTTFSEQRVVFLSFKDAIDKKKEKFHEDLIFQLEKEREYHYREAYTCFSKAKQFHEQKEQIYGSAMDFQKADEVAKKLLNTLFMNDRRNEEKQGSCESIFFGAATPNGAVNFINELTSDLKKRYIIKGRSGSGKSYLMQKIGKAAMERGYHVTYFLCGFDPKSVDMIIIEELGVAILDGTAPHVINPDRKTDKVIDMFEICIEPKIEEIKKDEIHVCTKNYKELMKRGVSHLEKAKNVQIVIDEYLDDQMDKEKLALLHNEMERKITETSN